MRGDDKPLPVTGEVVIEKKKGIAIGTIVDPQGNIQFHIVSTWWTKAIMITFFLLFMVCIGLGTLIFINKFQIDDIKQVQDERDANSNNRGK